MMRLVLAAAFALMVAACQPTGAPPPAAMVTSIEAAGFTRDEDAGREGGAGVAAFICPKERCGAAVSVVFVDVPGRDLRQSDGAPFPENLNFENLVRRKLVGAPLFRAIIEQALNDVKLLEARRVGAVSVDHGNAIVRADFVGVAVGRKITGKMVMRLRGQSARALFTVSDSPAAAARYLRAEWLR